MLEKTGENGQPIEISANHQTSTKVLTKTYLDHNATTPLNEKIIQGLQLAVRIWGNPSSIHWAGRGPKSILREARQQLAQVLGVSSLEIIFTSGGTESNNTVIRGMFDEVRNSHPDGKYFLRNEFITTKVEHPSVLKSFESIRAAGGIVHYLDVNREGEIDLEAYQKLISNRTALVSIMYANNETGVIFPIDKMVKIAHENGALFHSDCVQALGKVSLNLEKLNVDYASFSAHKIYALKGTGLLYVKKGSPFIPLIEGGAQERHRRGGTENTLGIWSLGQMTTDLLKTSLYYVQMKDLRDYFEEKVLQEIPAVKITSRQAQRLPNTSNLIIDGVNGETLLMSLDLKGFAVSTGAACASGSPEPSKVLLAIGLSREEAQSSLRMSVGWSTTTQQIDRFIETLKEVVSRLRSLPNFIEKDINGSSEKINNLPFEETSLE